MIKIGRVQSLESGYNMEDVIWKRELKRPKVYLVDESSLFGAMIKTNLEGVQNVSVLSFETGQELFDNMVFDYPEIIILDFKLGFSHNADHMNGMDIYQNLREVADIVPVIGITSESDERYAEQLRDSGILEVIDKNQADFLESLDACVSKTLTEIKK
jgi:DNA-binding response OmpR family regulator